MTGKHIITDGCEFQNDCIEYKDISYLKIMPICAIHKLSIACHDKVNKCKYYTLYKQLKRKEEECEKKSWEIGNLGYKIKNQRREINERLRQIEQLKRKEQECELLKEDEKSLLNVIDHLQKTKNEWEEKYNDLGQDFDQLQAKERECYKYKQTLTEIKDYCNKYPQNSIGFKKYILQKISECEVEND